MLAGHRKNVLAKILVDKPGAMSQEQRRLVAQWLLEKSLELLSAGQNYTATGPWTSRFIAS